MSPVKLADNQNYFTSKAQVGPLLNAQGEEINDPGAMTDTSMTSLSPFFTVEDTTDIPIPENVYIEDQIDRR